MPLVGTFQKDSCLVFLKHYCYKKKLGTLADHYFLETFQNSFYRVEHRQIMQLIHYRRLYEYFASFVGSFESWL